LNDNGQAMQVKIKGKSFDAGTVRQAMAECVHERAEHLRAMLDRGRAVLR